jgi:hypothetical protein
MSKSKGLVFFVSSNGGMVVVQHDDGFALIELLGKEGELVLKDVVLGDWDALGGETVFKDREKFDCYFQGSWGSHETPIKIARQTG